MEYFVTGGTGFIGRNVVEQLVEDGHDVIALSRSPEEADHLPDSVALVEGDITDKETLRKPMSGVDRVFHIGAWFYVGPGPRNREKSHAINVDGTRNVLELIGELDIPKAVYTSTVGVYGNTEGHVVDETHRPDIPDQCVYFKTKWKAHYEVAEPMIEDGLPLVIVQPGGVFGPEDKPYGSVRAAFRDWLRGDLPMLPRRFVLPYDYVEDVAQSHLLAMEEGEIGESYIIASEPREVQEVFGLAEEITGVSAPRFVSPAWFTLLEKLTTPIEWVTTPPKGFEPEVFRTYGGMEILTDNSKAKEELGIAHRPFEEGLREYLEWEMDEQDIEPPSPQITETKQTEEQATSD